MKGLQFELARAFLSEHKQIGGVLKSKKPLKQGGQKGQDPVSGRGEDAKVILHTLSFRVM